MNLAALAILTVAPYQSSGSPGRAMFGKVFFLLSGGLLYSNWGSPEFFSACALLPGLLFVLLGLPYLAGLLAARFMLAAFPACYEPEPEIFIERTLEQDGAMHADVVAAYPSPANPVKILFAAASKAAHAAQCGPGGRAVLGGASGDYPGGWKYLDGLPRCAQGGPAMEVPR